MKETQERNVWKIGCFTLLIVVVVAQQAALWLMVLNWSRRVAEIHPTFR